LRIPGWQSWLKISLNHISMKNNLVIFKNNI
jgi:hypothetical protein